MSRYVGAPELAGSMIIRDVTVVDPVDGSATMGQDVRIEDGTIAAVQNTTALQTDAAEVVEGAGRWLVPGFVDTHAHALNTPGDVDGAYALMLANGIVGFRQMSGSAELLAARRDGRLPQPTGAPALLATPGDILTPMNASTPEVAAATVREQQSQGADFVKAALVGGEAFLAALDEGRRLGIPVAGHLPADVDPHDAAARGMRSIEHLGPGPALFAAASGSTTQPSGSGGRRMPPLPRWKIPGLERVVGRLIRRLVVNPAAQTSPADAQTLTDLDAGFDQQAAGELAEILIKHQTWQCATLIRMHTQQFPNAPVHAADPRRRYIAADELRNWDRAARRFGTLPAATREALEAHWDAQLRLTRLFAAAGVPMLAGTDSDGAGGVIPGFALHDEFDLLAEAGLGPLTILRMTTSEPARFLGRADRAGSIAAGYDADLVLLDRDPLVDHTALHTVAGVVRAGQWWGRSALDAALTAVESAPGAH